MRLPLFFFLASFLCLADSFMVNTPFYVRKFFTPTEDTQTQPFLSCQSQTCRKMIELPLTDIINMNIPSIIGTSLGNIKVNEIGESPGTLISFDQNFEAQIYRDLAHLILDVGTIYTPDTILLRLFIFLGRICSILGDYVPDHSMTFDELIFQSVMLAFSASSLFNKLFTFTSSLTETTSFQDKRIFVTVFSPVGFTWIQYKTLLARNIIEWSHCDPGTFLQEDNESLLVTYRGEVHQFINGDPFTQYGSMRRYSYDIIGDFSEAHDLLQDVNRANGNKKNKRISSNTNQVFLNDDEEEDFFNKIKKPRVLQVGKTGAVLLRINTKMLLQHTNKDDDMTESTMNLYFSAMRKMLPKYPPPASTDEGDTMFNNNSTSSSNNSSSSNTDNSTHRPYPYPV